MLYRCLLEFFVFPNKYDFNISNVYKIEANINTAVMCSKLFPMENHNTLPCINQIGFFINRERQLAKERAERERQDMEKRKQKDLELKQKMEKIKELV